MTTTKPTAALRALLAPLPPLSSLTPPANSSLKQENSPQAPCVSKKRPRGSSPARAIAPQSDAVASSPFSKPPSSTKTKPPTPPVQNVPRDIAASVDAVRRAGAPADTLFFPGLSPGQDDEASLRATIRLPVRDVKLLRGKPGKKVLAWATFFNEADCVAALVALRRGVPGMKVRLHTPRAGSGTAGPSNAAAERAAPEPRNLFETRAEKIVAEGGLANTVMLRGLPLDVGVEEVTDILAAFEGGLCRPLRVRTSEGKSGKVRNFWLTYPSREGACAAFVEIYGKQVPFRCGKTTRVVPVVHNDATDAESKVRREREAKIAASGCITSGTASGVRDGNSGFGAGGAMGPAAPESTALFADHVGSTAPGSSSIDRLERFLREQPGKLYFLPKIRTLPF